MQDEVTKEHLTRANVASMNLVWTIYKTGRMARSAAVEKIKQIVDENRLWIPDHLIGGMLDDARSISQQYHGFHFEETS